MEIAAERIYYVYGKSEESVRKSTKALCVWDSGSVIVLVMDLLTQQQAGTQCPGSTWKKYHPHRLKTWISFFFILNLKLLDRFRPRTE